MINNTQNKALWSDNKQVVESKWVFKLKDGNTSNTELLLLEVFNKDIAMIGVYSPVGLCLWLQISQVDQYIKWM